MTTAKKENKRYYCSAAAVRYAEVLFELKIPEETVREAEEILGKTPELLKALKSPLVSKEEKRRVIDRIFPKEIRSFLKTASDHGKLAVIEEIFAAYEEERQKRNGIVTAYLFYAAPPAKEQRAGMERFLMERFRAKGVRWEEEERPELLGGFLLRVNGREFDYSVQGRLKKMRQKLTWR